MNWRWIVPIVLLGALTDAITAPAIYGSKTWNWNHTEVLHGWAAVREFNLVLFPIF